MSHAPDHHTASPSRRGRPHARVAAPRRSAGRLVAGVVAVGALGLGLAACGGSSSSHTTSSTATVPPPAAVRATLTAPTHTPKVNAPWHYVVRVTTGAGKPVAAVVHLQAMFQGVAVGQIGLHKVSNGVWSETITWPPDSEGHPLVFQVLATALGTTVTINYPLQVAPA